MRNNQQVAIYQKFRKKIEYLESKRVQAEAEARSKRLADWEDSQQFRHSC